jgi:hypothetical protein
VTSAWRLGALAVALCLACKGKHTRDDASLAHTTGSDAAVPADAADRFPELAKIPHVDPVRVIALPSKSGPRFDLGGPTMLGDIVAVSSSQFGFIGVDVPRGQIIWSKPAGLHVAPPLARDGAFVLIGDCLHPPQPPPGETQLGCARVVTPLGNDQAYVQIHGAHVDEFLIEPGPQRLWTTGERTLTWRRGEQAVSVDLMTGEASSLRGPVPDPPLVVAYKERSWEITRTPEGLITARGKPNWKTGQHYGTLLGAVYLPGQAPMVRLANQGHYAGAPEIILFDIDATGSLHGQVAFPVPGISVMASGIDRVGDVAMAIRLDASLERDFIVGYAANALLMWVYPLPVQTRADPIGIAVGNGAVVVFHDGDTLTILPELSAPAAAPGAVTPPLENTTP